MNARQSPDIVVAGLSSVDVVVSSDTFEVGVQNPADIRISPGGVGNAVSAMFGLGVSIGVSTRVRRDVFGDYLLGCWRGMGVDTTGVVIDDNLPTGAAVVLNHTSERTPFYDQGAIAAFGAGDVPREYIESSKVFLIFFAGALPSLDGRPMLELVRACHENGVAVILDLTDKLGADYSSVIDCLPYVNLVVNSVEAERMTGCKEPSKAVERLYRMAGGVLEIKCFAVTSSSAVSYIYEMDGLPVIKTIRSPFYGMPVKDVVGAGDAFRAGLAVYMSNYYKQWRSGILDWNKAFVHASAVAYLYLSRDRDAGPISTSDVERLIEGAKER